MMKKNDEELVSRGMINYSVRMQEGNREYPTSYGETYKVRSSEQVLENGRLVNKSVFTTVNPADKFAGLKASDFDLENVIAVGAIGSLQECHLNVGVGSELADTMEGTVDNIISAVDSAEADVNPLNE